MSRGVRTVAKPTEVQNRGDAPTKGAAAALLGGFLSLGATEQSLNNCLPNTPYHQVLIRATGTKNLRVQRLALRC